MRRKTYRIIAIMATALLALATSGCVDPLDDSLKPQPEEPTLTFWIHVPGSVLATKANPGDVASISPESMIYDVQVWVFDHNKTDGATKPLNYVYKDIAGGFQYSPNITIDDTPEVVANKIWEAAYKIQMPLPKEFVLGTDPCVDFYILANWQSIFNNKPAGDLTLAEVRDMVFGAGTKANAYFGTSAPTTAVPSVDVGEGDNQETQVLGLPISTVYKGANGDGVSLEFLKRAYLGLEDEDDNKVNVIDNDLFKRKLGVIELERAVAKVRFVFAKTTGLEGVQITKIVIGDNLIPNNVFAFPRAGDNGDVGLPEPTSYGGETILQGEEVSVDDNETTIRLPLLDSDDIVEVNDPMLLRSDCPDTPQGSEVPPLNMEAQAYDTYLTNSTSKVKPSTAKLVYFRESNEPVTGIIYYRKPGMAEGAADLEAPFDMRKVPGYDVTPSTYNKATTNLHRNHYWTVYAYFLGNGLYIKPVVLPWEDGTSYTYTQRGSAVVAISQKKETLFGYGWSTSNQNDWYGGTVSNVATRYNASANSTLGTWSDSAPTDYSTNKYFWTRSKMTLIKGEDVSYTSYSIPVAKSHKFITSISVDYAIVEDNQNPPTAATWMSAEGLVTPSDSEDPLSTPLSIAGENGYICSRTTTKYSDGESSTEYVWIKITEDGATVSSVATQYNASANSTLGTWSDSAPTDYSANRYFWTRTVVNRSNSTSSTTDPVAKSPFFITSITVDYALSTDNGTAPTSWISADDLNAALSAENPDPYIWTRTTTIYTDAFTETTTETDTRCIEVSKSFTEWYFRHQDEGYTNNWEYDWLHSQMVSAPGLNAGGAPIYANRIELRTNGFIVPLRLKLSNSEDFYIVTYNAASANYVSWTVSTQPAGYNEADGALIPLDVSRNGTTYFYVVPKDGTGHEDKTTEVYLVTAPTDGSGSQKIPFNAGIFPGSNENTEINFYSVSVDTFKSYYDASTRPSNIKPYDKSSEVTI